MTNFMTHEWNYNEKSLVLLKAYRNRNNFT